MKQLKYITVQKLEDLAREANVLTNLRHPNIVQFRGLTLKLAGKTSKNSLSVDHSNSAGSYPNGLGILFEYMEKGDLVNYLR